MEGCGVGGTVATSQQLTEDFREGLEELHSHPLGVIRPAGRPREREMEGMEEQERAESWTRG